METERTINELIKEFGIYDKHKLLWQKFVRISDLGKSSFLDYYGYAELVVEDFVNVVRSECKTLDDIDELLVDMITSSGQDYAFYKAEGLVHFAELAMIKDKVLKSIAADIERNK